MKEIEPTEASFRELASAADRLLADLGSLRDEEVAAPSRLPGWSRGHVLSHLARQAPALERLLDWARTGRENPQYTSREARNAEIEAGAKQPVAALIADVRQTTERFQRTVEELPEQAWSAVIKPFTGELCTPRRILVIRLRELELHRVDLALTSKYGVADIPDAARDIILEDVVGYYRQAAEVPTFTLRERGGGEIARFGSGSGPVVAGGRADLLAWLSGRAGADRLETTGPLPVLPPWL